MCVCVRVREGILFAVTVHLQWGHLWSIPHHINYIQQESTHIHTHRHACTCTHTHTHTDEVDSSLRMKCGVRVAFPSSLVTGLESCCLGSAPALQWTWQRSSRCLCNALCLCSLRRTKSGLSVRRASCRVGRGGWVGGEGNHSCGGVSDSDGAGWVRGVWLLDGWGPDRVREGVVWIPVSLTSCQATPHLTRPLPTNNGSFSAAPVVRWLARNSLHSWFSELGEMGNPCLLWCWSGSVGKGCEV